MPAESVGPADSREASGTSDGRGLDTSVDDGGSARLPAWVFEPIAPTKKRTVRRHADPYSIIAKIKLWPSKAGIIHGVRSVRLKSGTVELQTHCGQTIRMRNSRNSRVARHLRNKVFERPCPQCRIPSWKLDKFDETTFI
jgi:pyrrolysyl-tRNA synthetase-like protein